MEDIFGSVSQTPGTSMASTAAGSGKAAAAGLESDSFFGTATADVDGFGADSVMETGGDGMLNSTGALFGGGGGGGAKMGAPIAGGIGGGRPILGSPAAMGGSAALPPPGPTPSGMKAAGDDGSVPGPALGRTTGRGMLFKTLNNKVGKDRSDRAKQRIVGGSAADGAPPGS
jgi:hypothetical protein